jgi:exopolyphosphatase/guanosine-5'-triphosphate,3'-diphosphate pyrophosphatase
MTITRLGEGVDASGALAPAAISRTLDALVAYRQLLDSFGAVAVRATATSAARDATNAEDLFGAAEAVLGVRPELLVGEEEGRLSYAGATTGLALSDGPYVVVDVGGGSTELVAGAATPGTVDGVVSLDIGCVRVTERYLAHDPPTADELALARAEVAALVAGALATVPALATGRTVVAVAGTVSTLVTLSLGLTAYDPVATHHQRLSRRTVEALLAELAAAPLARRRTKAGLEPARADVIVGGALIVAEVMAALSADELVYSESDILDGVAADLLARTAGGRHGEVARS